MEKHVSIILVNYNGSMDTIQCIESLKNITYSNYRIIVVDNCSTDNSIEMIKNSLYEKCILIKSKYNGGFSTGNNIGINEAIKLGTDYILLLNNDTIVEPDFLELLVNEMENDSSIGITGSKILYYDKQNLIWSAGGYIDYKKSLGCHYGMEQLDDDIRYSQKKDVEFLTGCVQLIRKDIFDKVGLYDEDYFLYMEDVDFCARVLNKGFRLVYVPESRVYHKVSASTGGDESPLFLYYITRNRMLFNKKNQNNIVKSLIFYILYAMKLCKDPFTKKEKYKYVICGVKDYIKGNYGYQNIKF